MTHIRKWRFWRREEGSVMIEFAIWFPAFALVLGGMAEIGLMTARHAMLERGLDIAVRRVQLSTANVPQHEELKQIICDNAAILPDCMANLKLEMRPQNLRHFIELPGEADCTDRSELVRPLRTFIPGGENQLMVLRACAKIAPIFPSSALAASFKLDGAGDYALVSAGAYVQEPR